MYGPKGQKVSRAFDRAKCQSRLSQFKAVASFPIVNPKIDRLHSSTEAFLSTLPTTTASSTSIQTVLIPDGTIIASRLAIALVGYFKKINGSD